MHIPGHRIQLVKVTYSPQCDLLSKLLVFTSVSRFLEGRARGLNLAGPRTGLGITQPGVVPLRIRGKSPSGEDLLRMKQ